MVYLIFTMMNRTEMATAAVILENFANETGELPEAFVRLGVCVTCPDDATFDVAVNYLLEIGLLETTLVSLGGGRHGAGLRAAR